MDQDTILYLEMQKESKFTFENIDKQWLLDELMNHIGDPDSHIRDELVYINLAHLLHDGHFEKETLKQVAFTLASNQYQQLDMENNFPMSVLKRSFSSLQIAILLYVHRRDVLFTNEEFHLLFDSFANYYTNEIVLQGHDDTFGWIHAVAHGADLMAQFAKSPDLRKDELERIFLLAKDKLMISTSTYISDEDERVVNALVLALEQKRLDDSFLENWVSEIDTATRPKEYPAFYHFKNNRKNLLRSLYFRLKNKDDFSKLSIALEKAILNIETQR